ncbi:MAG: hypothetical protein ACJAWV_003722 [Flammeovirgaceae bacterium]|jgi:hypothetical protein
MSEEKIVEELIGIFLNSDNKEEAEEEVLKILEELKDEEGNPVDSTTKKGIVRRLIISLKKISKLGQGGLLVEKHSNTHFLAVLASINMDLTDKK